MTSHITTIKWARATFGKTQMVCVGAKREQVHLSTFFTRTDRYLMHFGIIEI